ncbi:hypothetical protein GCM10020001_112340 [Nonomuraea salmonea]
MAGAHDRARELAATIAGGTTAAAQSPEPTLRTSGTRGRVGRRHMARSPLDVPLATLRSAAGPRGQSFGVDSQSRR